MFVPRHLQDAASSMIGVGLLISPWIGGYADDVVATSNAIAAGSLVALVALGAAFFARPWQSWTQAVLGVWLMASPWLLAFETHEIATATAVGIGIPVFLLASWVLLGADQDVGSPIPASRKRALARRPARHGVHSAGHSPRR